MKMSCGACGHWLFKVFEQKDRFLIQCEDCDSVSAITVMPAQIKVDWPASIPSQGILCVMPGENEQFYAKKVRP